VITLGVRWNAVDGGRWTVYNIQWIVIDAGATSLSQRDAIGVQSEVEVRQSHMGKYTLIPKG